jgi:hypothetical protein
MSEAQVRKWKTLSDDRKLYLSRLRSQGLKSYWSSCTTEQRLAHSTAISKALSARGIELEDQRKVNISIANTKHNKNHPEVVQQRVDARKETISKWTDEQFNDFCYSVSQGHANRSDEAKVKTSKKMSRSGKLRVASESQEVKAKRSAALSKAHLATWDSYTDEERAQRSQSLVEAHAKQSPNKKAQTASKISASIAQVHTTRSQADGERIQTKISFTNILKHPTITEAIQDKVWSWYSAYDFETYSQIPLRRKVIKYIYKTTGRVSVSTLPELLDLNSLGKKDANQIAQDRSANRIAKLKAMSPEETARSRSRTGLTLMYKTPEFLTCRSSLERLFTTTDFSTTTQEQFKQKVLSLVHKHTGFKHRQLKVA